MNKYTKISKNVLSVKKNIAILIWNRKKKKKVEIYRFVKGYGI